MANQMDQKEREFVERRKADRRRAERPGGRRATDVSEARYEELLALLGGRAGALPRAA